MRKFAYMFVVFGLAVGLGVWLNQSPQTAALDQEFALPFAANAQSSDADAGAAEIIDMVQGAEDAPITVIEYAHSPARIVPVSILMCISYCAKIISIRARLNLFSVRFISINTACGRE